MREFAEAEIIVPTGPFPNRKFKCERQPVSALWFDAVDSGNWRRCVATGPTQSGKTLACFIIPMLYYLFEMKETVILFAPSTTIAGDKWRQDLLPAIKASRYRELLPDSGAGARGGAIEDSIIFKNNVTLKVMTGGSDDKGTSAFTSRIVFITETDGMDGIKASSKESDKISQVEGRTKAFKSRGRIFMECTVSTKEGRTWREIKAGTDSRIVAPCHACGHLVTIERQHLIGWKGLPSLMDARKSAAICCPDCGSVWTDEQRREAHKRLKLIHKGQAITHEGAVEGDLPPTDTLGFRWNGANNMLCDIADLAEEEWRGSKDINQDNAERKLCQQVWAIPPETPDVESESLEFEKLVQRIGEWPRGVVPPWATLITIGMDLGMRRAHWTAIAWGPQFRGHVVDYNTETVYGDSMDVKLAILSALQGFRDRVASKSWRNEAGIVVPVSQMWIDSNWENQPVYDFCRESGGVFRPSKGWGGTNTKYIHPKKLTTAIQYIGEDYHVTEQDGGMFLMNFNADNWKRSVQRAFMTPAGGPGSITMFKDLLHGEFFRHLMSETSVNEFRPGYGWVQSMKKIHSQNHLLDATTLAMVSAHISGIRIVEEQPQKQTDQGAAVSPITTPDGRPFVASQPR